MSIILTLQTLRKSTKQTATQQLPNSKQTKKHFKKKQQHQADHQARIKPATIVLPSKWMKSPPKPKKTIVAGFCAIYRVLCGGSHQATPPPRQTSTL